MDNMDKPPPKRADAATVAISILGLLVVATSFVIVFTQDDPTTRIVAIGTTVALWVILRFWRRPRV